MTDAQFIEKVAGLPLKPQEAAVLAKLEAQAGRPLTAEEQYRLLTPGQPPVVLVAPLPPEANEPPGAYQIVMAGYMPRPSGYRVRIPLPEVDRVAKERGQTRDELIAEMEEVAREHFEKRPDPILYADEPNTDCQFRGLFDQVAGADAAGPTPGNTPPAALPLMEESLAEADEGTSPEP